MLKPELTAHGMPFSATIQRMQKDVGIVSHDGNSHQEASIFK